MDSSEEITDDILSYLLGNHRESDSSLIIEGENVSTATDNDVNNISELDTSLNPLTSPSLTSAYSSKKLEWDSSADVGCLPVGRKEFKSKLSTLEKMALSNSASKLCLMDEDEQSLALIAKIDRVLAKSKIAGKSSKKSLNRVQKLPTWPSVDSASNASEDTVIPQDTHHHGGVIDMPLKTKKDGNTQTESTSSASSSVKHASRSQKRIHESQNLQPSIYLEIPLRRSRSSAPSEEVSSELFITCSVASEEHDLYASNNLQPGSIPVTPTNFATDEGDHLNSSQCLCVSAEFSETCPTHTSLSTEHTRRLRSEALGELQVYRGLKEHLKNLKDYVVQLEQTWKFLDQAKGSAPSRREEGRNRRSQPKAHPTVPAFPDLPRSSSCSHFSTDDQSSLARSISPKSDRSFELERLNLHDTDSYTEPSNQRKKSKAKCCAHCSLKNKSGRSPHKRPSNPEVGLQTNEQRTHISTAVTKQQPVRLTSVIVPQREPIAYDIALNEGKPTRPRSKTSLQEALKEKRPDFYEESERRRRTIQEITSMRREDKMDCNNIPRLFTYAELRKHTENLYRQLPEANFRYKDQHRKETVTSNRIRASVFQKKLQSRVLQGQLNLPHSTCL